jgi:hypothetical protein
MNGKFAGAEKSDFFCLLGQGEHATIVPETLYLAVLQFKAFSDLDSRFSHFGGQII